MSKVQNVHHDLITGKIIYYSNDTIFQLRIRKGNNIPRVLSEYKNSELIVALKEFHNLPLPFTCRKYLVSIEQGIVTPIYSAKGLADETYQMPFLNTSEEVRQISRVHHARIDFRLNKLPFETKKMLDDIDLAQYGFDKVRNKPLLIEILLSYFVSCTELERAKLIIKANKDWQKLQVKSGGIKGLVKSLDLGGLMDEDENLI